MQKITLILKKLLVPAAASVLTVTSGFFILHHKAVAPAANTDQEEDEARFDRPDLAVLQDAERTKDPALGIVPRERLAAAWAMVRKQRAERKIGSDHLASATWVERGPNNVGGRTRAIMFDPNDATNKKVWAGGVDGGLWYTNDITVASPTWTNVNDFWANLAISSIAYNPANKQEFYVGTGEGYYNVDAVRGAGIWKTSDGGATWNQLSSTKTSTFYYVQKIVVTSGGNIFAATQSGVQESTDGGTTWTKVLGSSTGASTNLAADMEIGADGKIYAAMGLYSTSDGVYRSATGASGSWTKLNTGSNGFPTTGIGRIEIACAPSDANRLYAMVSTSSSPQSLSNIYTSADQGANWTTCTIPAWHDQSCSTTSNDMTRTQAWYDLILAVDPNNASVVLAGGVDIMKSTDKGSTWTQITNWQGNCSLPNVHSDQHAAVYQPGSSAVGVFGCDGGIYYSSNLNVSSPSFSNRNHSYNVTQFYACAMHPTSGSNYFLAGAQDNGSQKFNAAGINATTVASGGDGAFCHIDQTNGNYQITSYVYNTYYLSTNGGTSFTKISGLSGSNGDFINPTDYDSQNGILYGSYSTTQLERVSGIRSTPAATQITISGMSAKAGTIRVSPYSPSGTTTLFVGTQNGKLYKVTNAQGTPAATSIGNSSWSTSATISCVELGASEQDILVTFSNYGATPSSVWRTTDGGTTWANKDNSSLPDMPVRWALYNPANYTEVLLATEMGVWSTTDITAASPAWAANSTGLANVRVDMFKYRSSDKMVIAATHGRGLFSSNVFTGLANAPVAAFSASSTTVCQGSTVTFTDGSTNTPTSWSWKFQGGNPAISSQQNPAVTYSAAGTYSVSLKATNAGGSDSTSKTSYITVNANPTVSVSVSPGASVCAGTTVTLSGSGANTYSWLPGGQTGTSLAITLTANATYTVTGTSSAGCSAQTTRSVAVNALPSVSVTVNPAGTLCAGYSATLTASGAFTYSWAPGQTGSAVVVSPSATTTYTVYGTSAQGCSASAVDSVNVSLCTGVASIAGETGITVFPNPGSGEFMVSGIEAPALLQVYNAVGKLVYETTVNRRQQYMKLQEPGGVYFLRIVPTAGSGAHETVKKIVIRE